MSDSKNVKYSVRRQTPSEETESLIVYNKTYRRAIEANVMLRKELNDFLESKGIWSAEKQKTYEKYIDEINAKQEQLRKGGIPLKDAKAIALDLKRLRIQFRDLIAERTMHDNNTAEGVADNAKFDYLVSVCVIDPDTNKSIFKDLDDYNARSSEPWVLRAASDLAALLYGLDPKYEESLPENAFLSKYKFVDSQGRLINKDGHLIEIDFFGKERLINDKGDYVAYDENGNQYEVDPNGVRVPPQLAFLDDDGNPVPDEDRVLPESAEEPKKTKKKKADSSE